MDKLLKELLSNQVLGIIPKILVIIPMTTPNDDHILLPYYIVCPSDCWIKSIISLNLNAAPISLSLYAMLTIACRKLKQLLFLLSLL